MQAVKWISPKGVEVDLNDGVNTHVLVGVEQDFMPEFKLIEQRSPVVAGTIVQAVTVEPRELHLPVMIIDDDRAGAMTRARALMQTLDPLAGDGRLIFSQDGVDRVLNCRYQKGFTDDGNGDMQQANFVKAMLTFYAGDPYWQDAAAQSYTFEGGSAGGSFFPILPITLVNPNIYAASKVDNSGDVEAWPIITIKGPGRNPVVKNLSTGKSMEFALTLSRSSKLIIDTRPRYKTVRLATGQNMFYTITPGSSLWPLVRGSNQVQIGLLDPDVDSQITFSYTCRYLSA